MRAAAVTGYSAVELYEIIEQRADSAVPEPVVREFKTSVGSEEIENRPWLVYMRGSLSVETVSVVSRPELIHNLIDLRVRYFIAAYSEY